MNRAVQLEPYVALIVVSALRLTKQSPALTLVQPFQRINE
jgi:hypothetical protein